MKDERFNISISENSNKAFDFKFASVEQDTFLENLDNLWNAHLRDMDHLREGIGLQTYAQKNPLHEYQKEGFKYFSRMLDRLKEAVIRHLFYSDANELGKVLEHYEAEQQRRVTREKQMKMDHESLNKESGNDPKNPRQEKLKKEAQKKARRRKRR